MNATDPRSTRTDTAHSSHTAHGIGTTDHPASPEDLLVVAEFIIRRGRIDMADTEYDRRATEIEHLRAITRTASAAGADGTGANDDTARGPSGTRTVARHVIDRICAIAHT